MQRCSRHCPMLQEPGSGCQLSCSSVNPLTRSLAVWSFALRSVASRMDQAGANVSCDAAIVRTLLDYKPRPRQQLPGPLGFQLSWCGSAADSGRSEVCAGSVSERAARLVSWGVTEWAA